MIDERYKREKGIREHEMFDCRFIKNRGSWTMKLSIVISLVMVCVTTTSGFGFSNYGYGNDYFKYGLYDDLLENDYGGSNYLGGQSYGTYGNNYNTFDGHNFGGYGGSYGHYDDRHDSEYSKLYNLLSHSVGYDNGGYLDYLYAGDDDTYNKNWWLNGYGHGQPRLGINRAKNRYSVSSLFLDNQLGSYNQASFGNLWKSFQPYLSSFSDSSSWASVPTHTSMTVGKGSYLLPGNTYKHMYSPSPVLTQSAKGGIFRNSNMLQYQNHLPNFEKTSFAKKYKKEGKGMTYGGKKIDDYTEKYLQTRKYKQKGKYREYY